MVNTIDYNYTYIVYIHTGIESTVDKTLWTKVSF